MQSNGGANFNNTPMGQSIEPQTLDESLGPISINEVIQQLVSGRYDASAPGRDNYIGNIEISNLQDQYAGQANIVRLTLGERNHRQGAWQKAAFPMQETNTLAIKTVITEDIRRVTLPLSSGPYLAPPVVSMDTKTRSFKMSESHIGAHWTAEELQGPNGRYKFTAKIEQTITSFYACMNIMPHRFVQEMQTAWHVVPGVESYEALQQRQRAVSSSLFRASKYRNGIIDLMQILRVTRDVEGIDPPNMVVLPNHFRYLAAAGYGGGTTHAELGTQARDARLRPVETLESDFRYAGLSAYIEGLMFCNSVRGQTYDPMAEECNAGAFYCVPAKPVINTHCAPVCNVEKTWGLDYYSLDSDSYTQVSAATLIKNDVRWNPVSGEICRKDLENIANNYDKMARQYGVDALQTHSSDGKQTYALDMCITADRGGNLRVIENYGQILPHYMSDTKQASMGASIAKSNSRGVKNEDIDAGLMYLERNASVTINKEVADFIALGATPRSDAVAPGVGTLAVLNEFGVPSIRQAGDNPGAADGLAPGYSTIGALYYLGTASAQTTGIGADNALICRKAKNALNVYAKNVSALLNTGAIATKDVRKHPLFSLSSMPAYQIPADARKRIQLLEQLAMLGSTLCTNRMPTIVPKAAGGQDVNDAAVADAGANFGQIFASAAANIANDSIIADVDRLAPVLQSSVASSELISLMISDPARLATSFRRAYERTSLNKRVALDGYSAANPEAAFALFVKQYIDGASQDADFQAAVLSNLVRHLNYRDAPTLTQREVTNIAISDGTTESVSASLSRELANWITAPSRGDYTAQADANTTFVVSPLSFNASAWREATDDALGVIIPANPTSPMKIAIPNVPPANVSSAYRQLAHAHINEMGIDDGSFGNVFSHPGQVTTFEKGAGSGMHGGAHAGGNRHGMPASRHAFAPSNYGEVAGPEFLPAFVQSCAQNPTFSHRLSRAFECGDMFERAAQIMFLTSPMTRQGQLAMLQRGVELPRSAIVAHLGFMFDSACIYFMNTNVGVLEYGKVSYVLDNNGASHSVSFRMAFWAGIMCKNDRLITVAHHAVLKRYIGGSGAMVFNSFGDLQNSHGGRRANDSGAGGSFRDSIAEAGGQASRGAVITFSTSVDNHYDNDMLDVLGNRVGGNQFLWNPDQQAMHGLVGNNAQHDATFLVNTRCPELFHLAKDFNLDAKLSSSFREPAHLNTVVPRGTHRAYDADTGNREVIAGSGWMENLKPGCRHFLEGNTYLDTRQFLRDHNAMMV